MTIKLPIFAVLLACLAAAGCHLDSYQLNRKLDRWQDMQQRETDPEKKYRFARETMREFLLNPQFQHTQESTLSQQERLILHRRMSAVQSYLIQYHARRALEAIEGPDPDWERARREWTLADSASLGQVPGSPTQFSMVHIQEGYEELTDQLIRQPAEYTQMVRDFPGIIQGLRLMSEFKFREAEYLLEREEYDRALESYILVFTFDTEHFPRADRIVREFTGRGIRETRISRFWADRYMTTFEGDRHEAYGLASQGIQRKLEEVGDSVLDDSAMLQVMKGVGSNYNIDAHQTMDLYYYMQSQQNGNLPEYLRIWRPQVLKGSKPVRPRYVE